jgi:phosphoglycerol transferase MdoB-like AlkP superfamily enzyme
MRDRLKLLGYFALFWLSFQIICRIIFLSYNHEFTQQLTAGEIALAILNGLKMDASISGYFLMLTGLLLTVSILTPSVKWLYITLNTITAILLLACGLIVIIDLELYRHWGFRLNTTPLFYMGSEAAGSVELTVVLKLTVILVILFALSLQAYSKFVAVRILHLRPVAKKAFLPMLGVSALMFLPIRGSFTVAPMNTGFVYFHKTKAFANHAAINVTWNFLYSVTTSRVEYPENFLAKDKAEAHFTNLYSESDSTYHHLFNTARPNIILFILESFTADVIEPLGGVKDIAPNLNALCSEGILFDNFYASGDRTDKAIISILSSYPAQPRTSIIKFPSKAQKLPVLPQHIRELGYKTSFVYGGDIDFANFRSYLTNCGFEHITTEDDFPDEINESKWGVHDHFVLDRAFQECDTAHSPFFKVILTLSSHEPFDVPMQAFIKGNDQESLFLNSCHYTDKSVGDFIQKAKAQPWWKNTVIIFVADHGHRYPRNKEIKDKERFRIPLLMIGGAVKTDTVIHTYANQTDIANTLLGQLNKPSKEFKFSKNILAPDAKSFAAYFFNDGYGFVTPATYIIYDNPGKQFLRKDNATDKDLELSKAYQQILYSDYNKR